MKPSYGGANQYQNKNYSNAGPYGNNSNNSSGYNRQSNSQGYNSGGFKPKVLIIHFSFDSKANNFEKWKNGYFF